MREPTLVSSSPECHRSSVALRRVSSRSSKKKTAGDRTGYREASSVGQAAKQNYPSLFFLHLTKEPTLFRTKAKNRISPIDMALIRTHARAFSAIALPLFGTRHPSPPPVPHSNPATLLHDSLTLSLFLIYFSLPRSLFRFLPSKSASKQASVAWGLGSSGNFSERQRRLLLSPSSAYLSLTIVSSKSSGTFRPYLLPPPVPFSLIALLWFQPLSSLLTRPLPLRVQQGKSTAWGSGRNTASDTTEGWKRTRPGGQQLTQESDEGGSQWRSVCRHRRRYRCRRAVEA